MFCVRSVFAIQPLLSLHLYDCFFFSFFFSFFFFVVLFFQAEDGIRDLVRSRGLGDVYKRQMHKLLTTALQPESCEIIDEGHLHIGHEGARGGRGHYRIRIASPRFQGLSRIAQHPLVSYCLLYTTDAPPRRS